MTGTALDVVVGAAVGLVLAWLGLVAALLVASPGRAGVAEAVRLLPDLLRLLGRLARDPGLPRSVRVRLWLTLAYLAMPVDLVPDVVPVVGYADDAVVVAAALRSVVRRAGLPAVERHWSGTPDGLAAVVRLAGLHRHGPAGDARGGVPAAGGTPTAGGPPTAGGAPTTGGAPTAGGDRGTVPPRDGTG